MGLSAILIRNYKIQATCEKCGIKSDIVFHQHKKEGYMILKRLGWKLRTTLKEAICKDCQ